MTFDLTTNSPCVSQGNKAIWNENLAVYQKSLRAFFHTPPKLHPIKALFIDRNNFLKKKKNLYHPIIPNLIQSSKNGSKHQGFDIQSKIILIRSGIRLVKSGGTAQVQDKRKLKISWI